MTTDNPQLDGETLARMRRIDAKILLEVGAALAHTVAAHPGHPPVVVGLGLCENEIQIVCGKDMFARVQALLAEAIDNMRKARGE